METNQSHVEFIKGLFVAADNSFKKEIREDGILLRSSSPIEFSSKALFTSLVQIGIPPEIAIKLPFEIIPFLKNDSNLRSGKSLSTSDIRVAVVQALQALELDPNITRETVAMWSTAYIRRYGNPENQFIKIIDNGVECDLNYEYVLNKILPHLITRIIDVPSAINPCDQYACVFSKAARSLMAKEVIVATNALNIYSIRYKTLINLLQDLVLEPPHPWMVNRGTMEKVVDYNLNRASFFLDKMEETQKAKNMPLLRQYSEECARHTAAAILAKYGAFLGVGCRYGLVELKRMLSLKLSNKSLWDFCTFHDIELDLKAIGYSTDYLGHYVERLISEFSLGYGQGKPASLKDNVSNFSEIAKLLIGKDGHNENEEVKAFIQYPHPISYKERTEISDYISTHLGGGSLMESEGKRNCIAVSLSKYQANSLQWAFETGRLSSLKVINVYFSPPSTDDVVTNNITTGCPQEKFDVFICYNNADKVKVKRIVASLKRRGLSPWFDESNLRPGLLWQRELENIIDQVPCVAVFIGENGFGPWQSKEIELSLRRLDERGCPIIPVILNGCTMQVKLPGFIGGRAPIDFNVKQSDAIDKLCFGITGTPK